MAKLSQKQLLLGVVILIAVLFFGLAQPTQAQKRTEELPSPGITPDSFWYFGEILKERIVLIFTFDKESKFNKYLDFGDERLSEAQTMTKQDRSRETVTALDEYISLMKRAEATVKIIEPEALSDSINTIRYKIINQIYYLDLILDQTDDQIVEPKLK